MITLGIESTAHTLGISILKDNKVLCNLRDMYITNKGGIHPTEAALHHKSIKHSLLNSALDKTKLKIEDINLIAFSNAPGLAPCLLQGLELAKELNKKYTVAQLRQILRENKAKCKFIISGNKKELIKSFYFDNWIIIH